MAGLETIFCQADGGIDTLTGGDGADEFRISFGVENYDIIIDFSALDRITFNVNGGSYSSVDGTLNFNTTAGFLGIDFL